MNAVQILDGAVGTLLEQMGYHSHPILWTAEAARTHPAMLEAIHLAYLQAGEGRGEAPEVPRESLGLDGRH